MTGVRGAWIVSAMVCATAGAALLHAQTLESRVARANGDVVQFHFAARAGVCGDGRGMLHIDGGNRATIEVVWSTTYGNYNDLTACVPGPVRAVVSKDGADVIRIQTVAGPLTVVPGATDLGAVSANDAARYFLDLARKLEGRPARSAILAAALADSAGIGDALLAIARDVDKARDLRSSALTWAARRAGVAGAERMATQLDAIAKDANERQTMRSNALSGLVNLDGGAGVASLIRLSERTDDAWLAGEAADALSRSNDSRVRPQLRKLLDNASTPEPSRVRVISALGNSDGSVRDAEALRKAYPRFSEKERTAALTALGNIGDRSSVTWMLARAKDPAETMSLRRIAVQRAERAGARAADFVALYDDPAIIEYELRIVIIDALATDGSKPALDKLLSIAQSNVDARVRRRAVTKLSDSGDPRAKALLQSIVDR